MDTLIKEEHAETLLRHGEAIGELTAGQKALNEALTKLTGALEKSHETLSIGISTNRESSHREFNELKTEISKRDKPNYTVWVALLGILLALYGMVFQPISSSLIELGKGLIDMRADFVLSTADLRKDFNTHEKLDIHPVAKKWVEDLEEESKIETRNRKENIALLREIYDGKIALLAYKDEKLRNEFENVRDNGSPAIRERLAVLETYAKIFDHIPNLLNKNENSPKE